MFKQYRTFYSLLLLIPLTTTIILVMYTYTVDTSLNTVRQDIQQNNLNRIRFVMNNLDHNIENLSMFAVSLEADPMVGLLPSIDRMNNYEQVKLMLDLTDKLYIQKFSEGWNNQISIFSTHVNKWIGASPPQKAPPSKLSGEPWTFNPVLGEFTSYRMNDGYTINVTFPQDNLLEMLDRSKNETNDPLFYHPGSPVIMNRYSKSTIVNALLGSLNPLLRGREEGTEVISVNGNDYLTIFMKSETLGWYMVDYLPLNQAFEPIVRTKKFFYIACIMLLATGVVTLLFLYRKVQIPIVTLLKGVRQLKNGDFSFRITRASRNEFDFLYADFNDMAAQIQDLIEKVYKEQLISREAMVKQLQAQINPHFLYNCLFFINNMIRLGNEEAVTAMTQNLAEYFRYSTRLDEPMTTLDKELGVVENYLKIQCLRIERLTYGIDVPDSMRRLGIPKLLIQPLVENGVLHGIEQKQDSGFIQITGVEEHSLYRLMVEDDGKGLPKEKIEELLQRIEQPQQDTMGCALWNIRQRMHTHFVTPSGIEFSPSPMGGLKVTLYWPKQQED
ncbi:sensor histidine kinase [Paenibacillus sp. NRS-1782]|uniref:sensor histidine kinase n=1 Tax=unclassified Paenibacillus TaxID=185978 RepID=UPI003D2E88FB